MTDYKKYGISETIPSVRAWDEKSRMFVYPHHFTADLKFNGLPVMFSVGFTDVNDVKIYAGDIVVRPSTYLLDEDSIALKRGYEKEGIVVMWNKKIPGWNIRDNKNKWLIIGNIFQK